MDKKDTFFKIKVMPNGHEWSEEIAITFFDLSFEEY